MRSLSVFTAIFFTLVIMAQDKQSVVPTADIPSEPVFSAITPVLPDEAAKQPPVSVPVKMEKEQEIQSVSTPPPSGVTRARVQRKISVQVPEPQPDSTAVQSQQKTDSQSASQQQEKTVVPAVTTQTPVKNQPVRKTVQKNTIPAKKAQVRRPRTIRCVQFKNLRYLHLQDVAAYYEMHFAFTNEGGVMFGKKTRVDFVYNKREGAINGVKVFFLYPMYVNNNIAYVSELDFRNVLGPVFAQTTLQKHRIKTIMLDPGHGGTDPGAKGPLYPEKYLNLQIANRVKKSLESMGFRVLMTRSGDTFPTLEQRTKMAAAAKPDLYLSIHCNSSTKHDIKGLETYAATPAGAASSSDNKPSSIVKSGNQFDQNNFRLAYEIQRAMVRQTGMEDRGARHARFYVIANASCPSALIECGYLSNLREGRTLAKKEVQEKIVSAIILGLANYASAIR